MDLPQTQTLLLNFERGVLRVTLNRPEAKNALSLTMLGELSSGRARASDCGNADVRNEQDDKTT